MKNNVGFYLAIILNLTVNNVFAQAEIATVSPISFSLSKAMVKGTELKVAYLPPKRLPINRVGSWLRKNRSQHYGVFDAFVGISSVKPTLDLYPSLRQSNIRLVDIDIAQAIMPAGEKVVLANNTEYFWLNSNNLLLMLGILKRDIISLWPEHTTIFNHNYQMLAANIRQINLQLDDLLMSKEIAFIVPTNNKLSPYVASLISDKSSKQEALELGLNYLELTSSRQAAAGIWAIDDFSRFSKLELISRLRNQVTQLKKVLNTRYN